MGSRRHCGVVSLLKFIGVSYEYAMQKSSSEFFGWELWGCSVTWGVSNQSYIGFLRTEDAVKASRKHGLPGDCDSEKVSYICFGHPHRNMRASVGTFLSIRKTSMEKLRRPYQQQERSPGLTSVKIGTVQIRIIAL